MNLNVLVFISWMQLTFCFNENTSFFYCLMNCLSYTQSYFSAGEEELQCLKYPNAASWYFIAPISQMPEPHALRCSSSSFFLPRRQRGYHMRALFLPEKQSGQRSSGYEKGPYGSLWVLTYSSHYRWVSLCSIWEWQASWQVRKAGQSRFAWCRGQTREASLVPVQFKNWLFLSQSTPRPLCGRENRGREVGFLSTTVRFLSSNIQAQKQATSQPQRAGTDHINSSPKPSFPLWRPLWHKHSF